MSQVFSQVQEMDARSDEFWLYRSYRNGQYHINVKFAVADGQFKERLDLKFTGGTLAEVVSKAYNRFSQVLQHLPEFDANRAITLHSTTVDPQEGVPF